MSSEGSRQRLALHNRRDGAIELLLEPWGMPLELPSRAQVDIEAHGADSAATALEAVIDDGVVTIYASPGARIVVRRDGEAVFSSLDGPAVPAVPDGMTVQGFVRAMFDRRRDG